MIQKKKSIKEVEVFKVLNYFQIKWINGLQLIL